MSESLQIDPFDPVIHLLFADSTLQIPENTILAERLAAVENSPQSENIQLTWRVQDHEKCLGKCQFGQHAIQIIGLAEPLPIVTIDQTIHIAHWQPQIKAAMRHHTAHIRLNYTGSHPDPVEKMIALYKLAHALNNENLLGIANHQAWTSHPVGEFLSPEKIRSYRTSLPFSLWIGVINFFVDKEAYWLVHQRPSHFRCPRPGLFCECRSGKNEHP